MIHRQRLHTLVNNFSKALFTFYNKTPIVSKTFINFCTYKNNGDQHYKDKIQSILSKIIINVKDQNKSIIDAGIVSNYRVQDNAKKVIIGVNMVKNFARVKNIIKDKILSQGFENVQVVLQHSQEKKIFQRKGNLSQIKKIIAVSSCKGGVGKSTVAANIAFGLKQQGFKVGIFDSDVYGPSLPTLVDKQGQTLESAPQNANMLLPKIVDGVKCMSFGFVANQPVTLRGPMASSIISQLILQTKWEILDYLIIDMPPGTGDVNLNMCEEVKLDGAVIVTTPQRLSFVDVLKGIKMFQDLRVRILAIVQNMSYYTCSKCKTIDQVFGKGHSKIIQQQLGIQNSFRLPLISEVSKLSDIGKLPVVVLPQQHLVKQTYLKICTAVKKQLEKPRSRAGVYYNTTDRLVIVQQDKKSKKIDPIILRTKCICNHCVDDLTGESLIKINQIDPEVYPVRVEEKGNYAVGIVWSDGHKNSIYSFQRLFSEQIPNK